MSPMSEERPPENVAGLPGRLGGVDAARAVAVLGMVIIHFGPNPIPDTFFGNLYEVPHGRASVLFVLLAATTCVLWRAALPRGPLEAALATPWWTFERVARLRTAHGRDGRAPVAAAQGSREREDHRTKRATAKSQVRE
jgi:hypothetical protein